MVPQTSCEKWSKKVLLWCENYLRPRQAQQSLWPQLNYSNVNQVAGEKSPLPNAQTGTERRLHCYDGDKSLPACHHFIAGELGRWCEEE